MDLERELRLLDVGWPETPSLRLELAPRARRRRRRLVLGVALAAAALAAALAVPQSRGAILRLLHLGGVTVKVVETLPGARARPLDAGLGRLVGREEARRELPGLRLPPLDPEPPLHERGGVISLVFEHRGAPVLLSELPGDPILLKKLAAAGTAVEFLRVAGGDAVWISGRPHVVVYPEAPPRLAGNVLLWVVDRTTYRLEGPGLTKAGALEVARTLG